MIQRQEVSDGEIDLYKGTSLIGHLFSTGVLGKPLELQVYTIDYGKHITVHSYEEADEWILKQIQGA